MPIVGPRAGVPRRILEQTFMLKMGEQQKPEGSRQPPLPLSRQFLEEGGKYPLQQGTERQTLKPSPSFGKS